MPNNTLISASGVHAILGGSRSVAYEQMKQAGFPKPVRIDKMGGRTFRWWERSEIKQWKRGQKA